MALYGLCASFTLLRIVKRNECYNAVSNKDRAYFERYIHEDSKGQTYLDVNDVCDEITNVSND